MVSIAKKNGTVLEMPNVNSDLTLKLDTEFYRLVCAKCETGQIITEPDTGDIGCSSCPAAYDENGYYLP